MKGLLLGLAAALVLLVPAPAEARMHHPYRGHRIVAVVSAPLDGFTAPAAAYGMRKLRTAYTGPAIRLRRTTGGEQDINFLGFVPGTGAPLDFVAANTFCAATTCFVTTWYDQSGNARHLTQTTAANQPALQFNCQNGLPCARTTAGTQQMTNTSVTSSSVVTINAVARHTVRTPGGGYCTYIGWGNQTLQQHSDFDLVLLNASGAINAAAAYQVWHSHTGVVAGAGSLIRVDATEAPNPLTGSGGGWAFFTGATQTCDHVELVAWDNIALAAGERATLHANQKSFWGF